MLDPRPRILMYHRIAREPDWLHVSPATFAWQMRLVRAWCHPMALEELIAHLDAGRPLPPRTVAITFDDGYRDNHDLALPILRSLGLTATFFVASGMVDQDVPYWWDRLSEGLHAPEVVEAAWPRLHGQLVGGSRARVLARVIAHYKELPHAEAQALLERASRPVRGGRVVGRAALRAMAAAGMSIGAHTVTHPILARMPLAAATDEIVRSRRELETLLEAPVRLFAYPNGRREDFSPELMQVVQRAGYVAACATVEDVVGPESPRYALPRVAVGGDLSLLGFARRLFGTP